ncbi:ATP-binding protein [Catenulispora rubra]|uniref:ATP-binding protein n=1 Tax=Catenulispora rubra TaxID=280293 RepID=UPI001891F874|nr:sensor histidine kinase [Catenulispora rubra]
MNADIALWCTAGALVVAIVLAVYWVTTARRLRARVAGLEEACAARDAAVGQLVALGLPGVADVLSDAPAARISFTVAPSLNGTAFAGNAGVLAQRYTIGLRELQGKVAGAVRQRVEEEAQQTTESAVRSFAETVVSLGASLSKVVAEAMRQHRGDETFETLTLIDHTVQQMIRQAQSYVVVCGGLPGRRWPAQSMTDVVRGAMGRIQDYQRIRPRELSRQVVGQAVEPAVHAVATLLDNAARYSPPGSFVDVTFQEGHHGVTVIVDDAGVGMNSEQLDSARRILSGQEPVDLHRFGPHPKIGFPTVAALSKRYGFQASIDGSSSPFGGTRAALFIPEALLAADTSVGDGVTPEPAQAQAQAQASVPAQVSASVPVTEVELTETGLPRRKRHSATTDTQPLPPVLSTTQPRPSVAAAWQNGAHGADRAATPSDPAEGTR